MRQYKDKVGRKSVSPIALLTDSQEETLAVQRYLDEHKGEYRTLESVASIFSFVPEDQQAKMPQVQKIRERIERKLGVLKGKDLEDAHRALEYLHPEPFTVDDLPEWVKDKFTDRQGRVGTFLVLTARGNKADAHEVGTITKELDDITVDGRTYHTSASYFILKDVYDIVRKEGPLALLLAALAALLMVIIDFGRVFEVTVAFLPLLLGIACFVGFMGLAGENFTMFNMIILPSVFGTSIDTSTHILHRIREEGAARIGQIANTTGAATFLGAMTNTIGFGSLIVATNPGLANIGQLAPIGLLICWLVCLTLTCAFGRLRGRQ
jgi:predicted RND superfamily exporter protein